MMPAKKVLLWVAFAVVGLFAFWQCVRTYQSWWIQRALLSHQMAKGEAVVSRVERLERRGGSCTIQIWARLVNVDRRLVAIKAPGGSLSLIGSQMDWFDCRMLERPAAFARMIAVGDYIPVVYAVDDPTVNRPVRVNYPVMMARVRFIPPISLALALGLFVGAIWYQKRDVWFGH